MSPLPSKNSEQSRCAVFRIATDCSPRSLTQRRRAARSLADELKKLQELCNAGALTPEEFAQAKAALLKNPPAPTATPVSVKAKPGGSRCYRCSATATTRCQSCGALSCAEHLQSIYVPHGRGGAYELRCASCYSSAAA